MNTLLIVYWNIRSVRNRPKFNLLEEYLNSLDSKIDIIVLSEVWINSNEVSFYQIKGYNILSKCNNSYAAGGILVYLNERIRFRFISNNMTSADTIDFDFKVKGSLFTFISAYRLHAYPKIAFLDEIEWLLRSINSNAIFVADGNINLLEGTTDSMNYIELIQTTRVGHASESCLDHIFIKYRDTNVFDIGVFDLGLSDHFLLGIKFEPGSSVVTASGNISEFREQTLLNRNQLCLELFQTNWDDIFSCTDVNSCVDYFYEKLRVLIEKSTIKKEIPIRIANARMKSPCSPVKKLKKTPQPPKNSESFETLHTYLKVPRDEHTKSPDEYVASSRGNYRKQGTFLGFLLITQEPMVVG